jgi:hypothetical protein
MHGIGRKSYWQIGSDGAVSANPTPAIRRRRHRRVPGGRAGIEHQLVRGTQQPTLGCAQLVGIHQVVELVAQWNSLSSSFASWSRAPRVRVFTVPSGTPDRAATWLWERSLQ